MVGVCLREVGVGIGGWSGMIGGEVEAGRREMQSEDRVYWESDLGGNYGDLQMYGSFERATKIRAGSLIACACCSWVEITSALALGMQHP